ncbi:MAG TPA: hypothetical protein VMW76_09645 [Bacteroidales bacterium]|nr:hypothetical protein [Bacteroidales bacterium]
MNINNAKTYPGAVMVLTVCYVPQVAEKIMHLGKRPHVNLGKE